MNLTALVTTKEQFDAVLSEEVRTVYPELVMFPESEWKEMTERAHSAGKTLLPALPAVFRSETGKYLRERMKAFAGANFDGILARNTEEFLFLREEGCMLPAVSDHQIYLWNRSTLEVLRSAGFSGFTAPVELKREELSFLSGTETEFIAYGRLPMMVTANCLEKTCRSCDYRSAPLVLLDRGGREMSVLRQCAVCLNVILNSVPLDLSDRASYVLRLGFRSVRLQFTTEDKKETKAVILRFREAFGRPDSVKKPDGPFTRGAFLRGTD